MILYFGWFVLGILVGIIIDLVVDSYVNFEEE